MMTRNYDFARDVAEIVKEIPSGKVLSYGDVAALAGRPDCPRLVGHILSGLGFDSDVPCHRVVNAQGRIAPHWLRQADLLKAEGVVFTSEMRVNMRLHRWDPFAAHLQMTHTLHNEL